MKSLSIFLLVILLWSCNQGNQTDSYQSTPQEVAQYTIEQFMDNERVLGGSFSQDKSQVLITSDRSGIFNLYTISVEGGEYNTVTESDSSSIFGVSYFPKDDRILFRMDDNGNEIFHLFVRETDGTVNELTPDKGARAVFYGWAHDGNSFFYGYNQRDPKITDVYEMDLTSYESTLLYKNDEGYTFGGISRDKSYMALIKPVNANDTDLFLYHFADQSMEKVNERVSANFPSDFGPDSENLYYLTDEGSEYAHLIQYNLETKDKSTVLEADWDVAYAYFSHGGTYRISLINEDAKNVLQVLNLKDGKEVDFPSFDNGDITNVNVSRDEEMMTFYVGSSSSPSDLYIYDLKSKEYDKLTDVLNPEINRNDLVTADVIRFPSFDGLEIPSIYYMPHQASPENPVPALVWVHGGPGGQSRQSYFPLIQYLVNHGYAVLAVNNRGSSGYGKTFFKMDNQNHGDKDLRDCVEGKNWLKEQAGIDPEKLGIIGGSYGGYMVMAALAFQPEEFDVGVNIFGVTNWIRTLKSIPPWWESFKDALYDEMGDPYTDDSVRLYNISPLFHAKNVTKPLIVLQGAQDPRVLKVESDEIVEAVRNNGVPVEYVLFEDEGHGFVKKDNQIEGYGAVLAFLNEHLKGEKMEDGLQPKYP